MTNPKWLKTAAQRSVQHTWTLGYLFEVYQRRERKSREDLARDLGCSLEVVDWLSLCRVPKQDQLKEQMELIGKRFSIEAFPLESVVRRAQVLLAFEESGGSVNDDVGGEDDVGEDEPTLLAARDHTSDDDETDS